MYCMQYIKKEHKDLCLCALVIHLDQDPLAASPIRKVPP